jgi:hypothetical protein
MTRLIGALLLDQHEKWITGKKYHDMDDYNDWKREKERAKISKMQRTGTYVRPA